MLGGVEMLVLGWIGFCEFEVAFYVCVGLEFRGLGCGFTVGLSWQF